jgi:4-amino-4-deoxy-L-arabinose transferase-like glycosyltransferase
MKLWRKPNHSLPEWAPLALIVLLALGMRLWRLGDANLWWDEALAIWAVRKGFVGVTLWTASDVHPPLYFWLLWGWVRLLGSSPFAMRTLSALLGTLTVFVLYHLGRLVGGRRVGLLSALLIALSRFHIWWSQEMRMYVLAALMASLSLLFFMRWLRTQRSDPESGERRQALALLALYVAASLGGLYTIFLTAAVIVVQNIVVGLILLGSRGYRRLALLGHWVAAQLTILAVFAIWLGFSWKRMPTWSTAQPFDPALFVRLYATLLTTGISTHLHRYTALVLPPLIVLGAGGVWFARWGWAHRAEGKHRLVEAATLTLSATLPVALVYLSTIPRGLFYTPRVEARYLLPFAPAFWVLLAASIVAVGRRWRVVGWGAGLVVLAIWIAVIPGHYGGRLYRDTLGTMTRAIVSQARPGDVVLLDSGGRYPLFLYDYDSFPATLWRPPMEAVSFAEAPVTAAQVDDWMASRAPLYGRIWLAEVEVHLTDPDRLVAQRLDERLAQVAAWQYGANRLALYDAEARRPEWTAVGYRPQHPVNAPVGTGGILMGWDLPASRLSTDSTLHLTLYWARLPQEPVEVTLRGPSGQVQLRRRAAPSPQGLFQRQQFDLHIGRDLSSGEYTLAISPPLPTGELLDTVLVAGSSRQPHVGPPQTRLDLRFGEDIVLEGYAVQQAVGGGLFARPLNDAVILDLYWRAEGAPMQDYTVFTHLIGAAFNPVTQGPVWGQHDGRPAGGSWPTTAWNAGDVVIDRHLLVLDPQAPDGDYWLEVGMYRLDTGERLPVFDAAGQALGDHVALDAVLRLTTR